MANIRAGTAYIDVKLGAIDDFKNKLKEEVERAGTDAGKKLGDSVKKSVPASTGSDIGKKLNKDLTKAFFQDAKTDMAGGFRALANQDIQSARGLFKSAGKNLATSLKGGWDGTVKTMANALKPLADGVSRFSAQVGAAASKGWTKFQEFGKAVGSASQKMGFLSFQIQNFGLIASAVFTAPTSAALAFGAAIGVKTAADIENATNALKYLLPAGTDVEQVLRRIQQIAIQSPVFDTADLLQYAQTFTSAGVEINKTERFLKAFSNVALVTGTSTDKANLAVRAITQAFGKGKLMAEELNQQLGEAMPSVLRLLRDELGVTQPELNALVKEGKITGEDLIAIFTRIGESEKFLKGAASGAQTLSGVWQQLKEQIQTQLGLFFLKNSDKIKKGITELIPTFQKLIDNAGPAFLKMIDLFSDLVKWITKLVNWYDKLTPGQQKIVNLFMIFASVIGPIVLVLGTLMGAFAGIAAGISAVATPVGGVVLAVAALVAGIILVVLWLKKFISGNSELAKSIRTAWNDFYAQHIGPVVDSLKALWVSVQEAFNQVKNAITQNTGSWKSWAGFLKVILSFIWASLKAAFGLIVDLFKTLIDVLGPVFKAIGSLISGVIKIFKGLTDFLIGVFTGDWSRAWEGIKQIWDGIWDAIVGTLVNLVKAIWNLIKGLVNGIVNFFKSMYNTLVGHSIVPDMVNAIIGWFRKLVDLGKSILNALGNFIAGLYNRYFAPFVNRIRDMASTVADRFRTMVNNIKSVFSNAGSWLYNAGKNIVNGLVNGVRSMAGYLKNAILNLIPAPVRSIVSSALGINSPSKVFFGYGENVVQGFVNGIAAQSSQLENSLAGFNSVPAVTPTFGSPREPLFDRGAGVDSALKIENYYANDNVDPWRQSEDWYFLLTTRGGVA